MNDNEKTYDLCLEEVKKNCENIKYIPKKYKDEKLCMIALRNGYMLEYIPLSCRTNKLLEYALSQNGMALEFVSNQTIKLCSIAINNTYVAFRYVDKNLLNEETLLNFIRLNGLVIQFIRDKTYKICKIAIEQNPLAFKYIDHPTDKNNNKTIFYDELAEYAINKDSSLINYVKCPSLELCKLAIKKDVFSYNQINFSENSTLKMKLELQLYLVSLDGLNIKHIDYSYSTKLCDVPIQVQAVAVKQNGLVLQYITNTTIEVKILAIQQNGLALQYIDKPNYEMEKIAVSQNGLAIQYIKSIKNQIDEIITTINKIHTFYKYKVKINEMINRNSNVNNFIIIHDLFIKHNILKNTKLYKKNITNRIENIYKDNQLKELIQNDPTLNYILEDQKLIDIFYIIVIIDIYKKQAYDDNIAHCVNNKNNELYKIAVQQNGLAVYYIKNPDENIQLLAVRQNGLVLHHTQNSNEEIQLEAVKQNGLAIKYIEKPSEDIQIMAVSQNGLALEYIKNASSNIQLLAILNNSDAIRYCNNVDICMKVFKQIIKRDEEFCPICQENVKIYASFNCNKKHYICLECLKNSKSCYYRCKDGYINLDVLYIN